MTIKLLSIALLLAAACCAAGAGMNQPLGATRRKLLKLDPPSICTSYGDCKPVAVRARCPADSVPDAKDPTLCWEPCPGGYRTRNLKWCMPRCPKAEVPPPWVPVVVSIPDKMVTCKRCKERTCEYVAVKKQTGVEDISGCYQKCNQSDWANYPFLVNSSPLKCCSKKCPDDFPIFISDTVCASLTGKQRTVDRKCLPRKPCDADEVKLDILPRNTTSVACPSKPPAVLPVTTPNGLFCYRCTCGLPELHPNGSVSCSGVQSPCPAGYKKCGPYCWDASDPSISGLLSNTDEATCYPFLVFFKNCLRICPREAVATGPNQTGLPK